MDGLQVVQAIVAGGAAAALWWVLKQVIEGNLHSTSEVNVLTKSNRDLLKINSAQAKALQETNEQQREIFQMLKQLPVSIWDRSREP